MAILTRVTFDLKGLTKCGKLAGKIKKSSVFGEEVCSAM